MKTEKSGDSGRQSADAVLSEASEKLAACVEAWHEHHERYKDGKEEKMKGFNRVVLMGRLTRDPQARQIPSGTTVADLGLAVSEAYKNKDGEFAERICFIDIVTWGRQAENCAQYLKKGSPILVEGRLQLDRWESTDGQKRSKHRVRADRVQFLNGNGKKPAPAKEQPEAAAGVAVAVGGEEDPF